MSTKSFPLGEQPSNAYDWVSVRFLFLAFHRIRCLWLHNSLPAVHGAEESKRQLCQTEAWSHRYVAWELMFKQHLSSGYLYASSIFLITRIVKACFVLHGDLANTSPRSTRSSPGLRSLWSCLVLSFDVTSVQYELDCTTLYPALQSQHKWQLYCV